MLSCENTFGDSIFYILLLSYLIVKKSKYEKNESEKFWFEFEGNGLIFLDSENEQGYFSDGEYFFVFDKNVCWWYISYLCCFVKVFMRNIRERNAINRRLY